MDGSRAMRPPSRSLAWVLIALFPGAAAPGVVPAAHAAPPEPAATAAAPATSAIPATPAPDAEAAGEGLSFEAYLEEVAASNLDYAAARYNVSIAEAQLVAARVFPNPTLNGGTSGRDVTHHGELREPANDDAGVTQTIELGGKRRKRVAVAQANLAQAAATLEDFFRMLRGNAATAFVDALTKRRIAEEKLRSAGALDRLVAANRKRLEVGDIGEIDLTQSRVDALQLHADHLASESDAQVAAIALEQLLGRLGPTMPIAGNAPAAPSAAGAAGMAGMAGMAAGAPRPVVPVGNLEGPPWTFDETALVAAALQRRADVVAARRALESALAGVAVAKALAVPDLSVSFSYQENQRSHNDVAPAPEYAALGLSVSFPVPLWNQFRGELEAARGTAAQSERALRGTELRATVDVRQALARYRLADQRAAQFQGGALDDAAAVYQAKLFSYQHGAATLLDVLNAQRAQNDVRLAYVAALDERAKALIGVEQAAGIWDVDF
ncbi:MAG TPA: TolC family protein [Thermoanaerobaculia bacterium]